MYWAIEISPETSNRIQKLIEKALATPKDWVVYCDHITIVHSAVVHSGKISTGEWTMADRLLSNFEGHSVPFEITSLAHNENVIAVGVSVNTLNKHSHITVACAPGHKPVESNELEEWTPVICFEEFCGELVKRD